MDIPGREFTTRIVKEDIKKIKTRGYVLCTVCNRPLKYENEGHRAIIKHFHTPKHIELLKLIITNTKISFGRGGSSYGVASNLAEGGREASSRPTMAERRSMAEAKVIGVMAEHGLPLGTASFLVELAQDLANDPKALDGLTMERTSTTYKLKFGLGKTFHERTIENMKKKHFSLNMDESFSSNDQKVLTILVSYFSDSDKQIVVEHLESVALDICNSEMVYTELVNVFHKYEIPWNNLCSILMDSCGVMRGSRKGVEKRVRDTVAPHLLDIDGDVCHHLHNVAKKFCEPFDKHVENFFTDLHTHFKASPDLRGYLERICNLMGKTFTKPDRFLNHRWLLVYDVSISTLRYLDLYFVFFYSCLSDENKHVYRDVLNDIYEFHALTDSNKTEIKAIQKKIESKKMGTPIGEQRKERLIKCVTDDRNKTKLVLTFYTFALPKIKAYVCLFQSKIPLVHKMHDKQREVYRQFLGYFFKSDKIKHMTPERLKSFDMDDKKYHLPEGNIGWGSSTKEVMKDIGKKDSNHPTLIWFRRAVKTAYLEGAKQMQKTVPIDNPILQSFSALDPFVQEKGMSDTLSYLFSFPQRMTNILLEEEKDIFEHQVRDYLVDTTLPKYRPPSEEDDSEAVAPEQTGNDVVYSRADQWWGAVKRTGRYNILAKVALAAFSCFHGPLVESSFNNMGNIMDPKRSKMNMGTYNAYLTSQYYFKTHNTDAIKLLSRKDPVNDAVDTALCVNMKNAHIANKKDEEERNAKKLPDLETKRAYRKKLIKEREEEQRVREKSLKRKQSNASLEQLSKKLKKAKK